MSRIHKTPTVYQMEAAECGAASLAMILAYHGKYVSLEQLRVDAGVSRDGSKAGNLIRAAQKHCLDGHGYKKSFDGLRGADTPCVILLQRGHFVVLEGFRGRYAYINDPASGRRRLASDELRELYGGIVLTFSPSSDFQKDKRSASNSGLIHRLRQNSRGALIQALFSAAASAFCCIGIHFLKQWIDHIYVGNVRPSPFGEGLFVISAFIAAVIMWLLKSLVGGRFRTQTVLRSSKSFTEKLLRLPLSFYEQRYTGEAVNRAKRNDNLSRFISDDFADAVAGAAVLLMTFIIMALYSPLSVLTALGCTAVQAAASAALSRPLLSAQKAGESILAGKIYTGLSEMETLKAAAAEQHYLSALSASCDKLTAQRKTRAAIRSAVPICVFGLRLVSLCVLSAVCVSLTSVRILSFGETVAILLLYIIEVKAFDSLLSFFMKIKDIKADISACDDVMDYPEDALYKGDKSEAVNKADGDIALESVSFSYSALSENVISDLSLHIATGSAVGIVGTAGSGKSTVAKLICGLYRPQKGRVTLDGENLVSVPKSVINASISVVSQQPALFSGTVRDNITMWNTKIPERDIVAAAGDACILDHIRSLPGGFDAPVSENGANFSVGQSRRLEIARALATDPSVLILDEATAALDAVTEQRIMENIKRRGCTCIVIAHRLSAVHDCDAIVVLDKGRMVQHGTHKALAGEDGLYRTLISSGESGVSA